MTLFTKKMNGEIFICQVYVDDIIFGSTNEDFCKKFGDFMSKEFEMSMIGKLSFFLGFQVKQMKKGSSSLKRSTLKIFSRDSRCKIASQSKFPWHQMDFSTWMREVTQLTKLSITL